MLGMASPERERLIGRSHFEYVAARLVNDPEAPAGVAEEALTRWLIDQRRGGQSFEGVMYALKDETGEEVSGETIRRWCLRRGIA